MTAPEHKIEVSTNKAYEEMTIEELQQAKSRQNGQKPGPITDQMRRDVMENVYHNSLINWVKSFREEREKRKKVAAGSIRRWSCGILVCA